jgi:hypothetical protein
VIGRKCEYKSVATAHRDEVRGWIDVIARRHGARGWNQ